MSFWETFGVNWKVPPQQFAPPSQFIHCNTDGCKQGRLASIESFVLSLHFKEITMQKLIQEALAVKRETLLRKREVLRMTGLSNSTFYNRIKEGVIPNGVPIGR